jgi:hypothetical protein
VQHQDRSLGERKPNPHFGLVYHVMNSTCIDTRVLGLNICMYRRGKYIKNPLKKYMNAKGYYTSNTIYSFQ